jgi:peptidoglycan/xylan/chitin deacetylase (PgdA/CDA1 family)
MLGFVSSLVVAEPSGPAVVATADYKLWHQSINSADAFDKASRAALLVYVTNLNSMQAMPSEEMLSAFKIETVNRASVQKWINQELDLTLANYQKAAKTCVKNDWTCATNIHSLPELIKKSESALIPANLMPWKINLNKFTRFYIGEQMRLAALFPKITSEIDTFSNNEWTGAQLADKQFYLTFDDGPSVINDTTDDTIAMLATQKKSGTFFVLGSNLQNRLNVPGADKKFYGNQCVALHGWEHQSHAQWDLWQDSIIRTQALVVNTVDKNNVLQLFRPPYGQRKADSDEFFKAHHLKVALWNIDSQDWIEGVDVDTVANRVITLALIKRHGVVLFHDFYPKASVALPIVFSQLGSAITWNDCHSLEKL